MAPPHRDLLLLAPQGRSPGAARRRPRVSALAAAHAGRRRLPLSRRALLRDGPRLQGGHRPDGRPPDPRPAPRRGLLRPRAGLHRHRSVRPRLLAGAPGPHAPLPDPGRLARRRGPRRDLRAPARHRQRDARRGRPSRARDGGRFRRLLPPGPRRGEGPCRGRQEPGPGLRSRHALGLLPRAARDRPPRLPRGRDPADQQRPARSHAGDDPRGHHGPRARPALRRGRARLPRDARAPPRPLELPARHLRHDPQRHPRRVQADPGGSRPRRLHPLRLGRQGEAVPHRRRAREEPGHPSRHDPRGRLGPRAHAALRDPARRRSAGSPRSSSTGTAGISWPRPRPGR